MVHQKYVVEFFFLYALRLIKSSMQGPEDDSITYLCMSVSLRMFDRDDYVLDTSPCPEVFISISFELSAIICDNDVWEVVPVDEVFPV